MMFNKKQIQSRICQEGIFGIESIQKEHLLMSPTTVTSAATIANIQYGLTEGAMVDKKQKYLVFNTIYTIYDCKPDRKWYGNIFHTFPYFLNNT